jgi:hypothetical protein
MPCFRHKISCYYQQKKKEEENVRGLMDRTEEKRREQTALKACTVARC